MKRKYQLIRAYEDCTCMTETSDNLVRLLNATAIYMEDDTLTQISIWECGVDGYVLSWNR